MENRAKNLALSMVATLVVGGLGFALWAYLGGSGDLMKPVALAAPYDPSTLGTDDLPEEILAAAELPRQHQVGRGQTLVHLFEEMGFERPQANRATFAMQAHMDPRDLRAGAEYAVYRRTDETISKVVFPLDRKGEVSLRPAAEGWQTEWRDYRLEERTKTVSGRLDSDLSTAMQEAGAPYALASALANVLQWDLDFNRDLRRGDEFSVTYQGLWVEGRFQGVQAVEAAVYTNRGRTLEAFRFNEEGDSSAYYDGSGQPLRKQFLKSPLPFTRVTSRFSHSRLHPVLKIRRPHYGVDYGAPTGTPVRATASGTVTFRGSSRGAGNMIKIRHPNGYETAYLHLSKFNKGACRGCSVSQGTVVGYVGATGLATGPHLDYRVKRNGRYLDPLKLPNAPTPPLKGVILEDFFAHRDQLRAELPQPDLQRAEELPAGGLLDVARSAAP